MMSEPLRGRSRLSRSLDTWTDWFINSLVLQYFLDSLLVLFSLSFLPLLSISWLILTVVLLSSLQPHDIFCVFSTSYSCLSPDNIFSLQPRFLSSKETCLLCLPRQMVLLTQCVQSRLIKIPAASSGVCRVCSFSWGTVSSHSSWIQLIEPLSFQATHTWMPSVPSVRPGQLSSMFLEAFSPSQIYFAYQQLVNLPEALLFSP